MFMPDRNHLNFECVAKEKFAFLTNIGFSLTESLPTLICYQKGNVDVHVFHGRTSYEIGVDVLYGGVRHTLAEIVDSDVFGQYDHFVASTAEGVVICLEKLASLLKHHGAQALNGDSQYFLALNEKRKISVDEYWQRRLAMQIRPQANDAFRRGDYAKAAELYSQIRLCLSSSEMKKLALSEERCKQ